MVELNWCVKTNGGLKLVETCEKLGRGYLKMAEDAIGTMQREKDKNFRFSISAGYYSIYYSVYAIMQKLGFKCEIHSCSIEFVKTFLGEFYSRENLDFLKRALMIRNNLQYYVDREINKSDLDLIWKNSYDFFVLSRDIFSKLGEKKIKEIRNKFEVLNEI